jgi:cell division protein FtsB
MYVGRHCNILTVFTIIGIVGIIAALAVRADLLSISEERERQDIQTQTFENNTLVSINNTLVSFIHNLDERAIAQNEFRNITLQQQNDTLALLYGQDKNLTKLLYDRTALFAKIIGLENVIIDRLNSLGNNSLQSP